MLSLNVTIFPPILKLVITSFVFHKMSCIFVSFSCPFWALGSSRLAYLNALNKAIDYVKVVNRRKIRKAFGVREKKKKGELEEDAEGYIIQSCALIESRL